MNSIRQSLLLQTFSVDHLMRLRLHSWVANGGGGGGDALTVSEVFETTTNAVWGDGGFGSARAKLWQNWDLMLFWLEVLQARARARFFASSRLNKSPLVGSA